MKLSCFLRSATVPLIAFGAILSSPASAAPCTGLLEVGLPTQAGYCYGTLSTSAATFSLTPQATTTESYLGSGFTQSTTNLQPNGSISIVGTRALGSTQSSTSATGSAPGATGFANASADLRTGELKVSGFTTANPDPRFAVARGYEASARLGETVRLYIPKDLPAPVVNVIMDIDGELGLLSSGGGLGTGVTASITTRSPGGSFVGPDNGSFNWRETGTIERTLTSTVNNFTGRIDLGDAWQFDFQIDALLSINGSQDSFMNFSNTARLRFELSDGITYTTGSGMFLAGIPQGEVPEPGVLVLSLLALGMLVAGRRVKRSSSQH